MASISLSKSEKSYIQAGLLSTPPTRADGRSLTDYRAVALETGTIPLANGSARVSIGANPHDGSGGTVVLAGVKLEVVDIGVGSRSDEGVQRDGGLNCTVNCSPAAYPHLSQNALDELQYDLTTLISTTLSHRTLHPANLIIVENKKAWQVHLDLVVFADAGNVYDALFMASRAALWDTKVPRTRGVGYKAPASTSASSSLAKGKKSMIGADEDVEMKDQEQISGLDTRTIVHPATDFELPDYWDEGEPLDGQDKWPVCVTLNIPSSTVHFLDATLPEDAAVPFKLLVMFAFSDPSKGKGSDTQSSAVIQGVRTLGIGEMSKEQFANLIKSAEIHARELWAALNLRLREEATNRERKGKYKE
ncbi:hypothetical protein CVT24_002224 [Panaeolus cyanescens]|uniref:Ribosomal RNA-processing protein 42 n=1 Tax=Panaeolus cyanescens TaxID=181874 RepID=A0A409YII9_9AGAR|nr:hypothetical protein CVT24_002224 [Panaeolus cyanescens]